MHRELIASGSPADVRHHTQLRGFFLVMRTFETWHLSLFQTCSTESRLVVTGGGGGGVGEGDRGDQCPVMQ